ncbi:MAG: hypothetical protein K5906_03915 [Bacilli bacterium]|nr:hypothetical protein [Bacilli bacterium]
MKKIFLSNDVDKYSKIYSLLGYKEVNRRNSIFKKHSIVTYQKEKEVTNFAYLRERYAPKQAIPFFFVILLIVIAVALATTYLIITITNPDADRLFYFYVLMLPTFFFTLLATGVSFYRYIAELKNIERIAAIPLLEKEINKNENIR